MTEWTQWSAWLYTWAFERLPTLLDLSIQLVFILLLAWGLRLVARRAISMVYVAVKNRTDCAEDVKRIDTLVRVARYAASVVVVVIAGGLVLSVLGVSVAPLLATAGVAGIAIGFGAQSLVKDLFAGFFVLLENQIRVGDMVSIAGHDGMVEEITLRYVRLRDYEGNVHFVPNGEITTVTSRSREFAHAVLDIRVHRREQVDDIFELMKTVATTLREDEKFGPKILDELDIAGVHSWDDSSITLRARLKVVALTQWEVKREFLRRLKAEFDMRGHEIPYPQVTLSFARETEQALVEQMAARVRPRKLSSA